MTKATALRTLRAMAREADRVVNSSAQKSERIAAYTRREALVEAVGIVEQIEVTP